MEAANIFSEIQDFINNNSGVLVLLSGIAYIIKQSISHRLNKNQSSYNTKNSHKIPKILDTEETLFKMFTTFYTSSEIDQSVLASKAEEFRLFVLDNKLYLGDRPVELALKFADYILEDAIYNGRDIKNEDIFIDEYNKYFKS